MLASLDDLKVMVNVTTTSSDAALQLFLAASDAAVKTYCGRAFEKATYTEYPDPATGRELLLKQWPVRQITGTDAAMTALGVWYQPDGYWGTPTSSFAAATKLVSGTDYALDPDGNGRLYRIGNAWADWGWGWGGYSSYGGSGYGGYGYAYGGADACYGRRGSVKAVYVAGWDPSEVPADLAGEVLHEAAMRWKFSTIGVFGASSAGSSDSVQLGQFRSQNVQSVAASVIRSGLIAANQAVLDRYKNVVFA